jgi:hypothetical protein
MIVLEFHGAFRCDTALKLGGGERDFKVPLTDVSIIDL